MTNIFLSYRSEDSPEEIARIRESLYRYSQNTNQNAHLTCATDIAAGEDFHKNLTDTIRNSEALLVIIGKNWLNAKNNNGMERLQDPTDVVRTEIESAFVFEVPVLPVLIEGTMLPLATQMPHSLLKLTTSMASPVRSNTEFDSDIEQLVSRLNNYLRTPFEISTNNNPQKIPLLQRLKASILTATTAKASRTRQMITGLTAATIIVSLLSFHVYAKFGSNEEVIKTTNAVAFVATTKSESGLLAIFKGKVTMEGDTLQLTTVSGALEPELDTRGFVQSVRIGLAKKTYAFDRFKVVSWSEPHIIKRWINKKSSLSLSTLDSTITIPNPEFESTSAADNKEPLKNHWLVLQVRLSEDTNADGNIVYAHSDKDVFNSFN